MPCAPREHLRLQQLAAHRRHRPAPMALRHAGQVLALPSADARAAHAPRVPEAPHRRAEVLAAARHQIVAPHAVVVAAQAAQAAVLEARRRRRDLQEIVAVPQQLHAEPGGHVDAVAGVRYGQPIATVGRRRRRRRRWGREGRLNAGAVDLHAHLLAEIHFGRAQPQRDRFRPGRRARMAVLVGDANGERVVGTTVAG